MLCVVFRNKPTHHLIAKTPEGVYAINKKTYDGHKNVGAVRLHLFPPAGVLPTRRFFRCACHSSPARCPILAAKLNTTLHIGRHTHTHKTPLTANGQHCFQLCISTRTADQATRDEDQRLAGPARQTGPGRRRSISGQEEQDQEERGVLEL